MPFKAAAMSAVLMAAAAPRQAAAAQRAWTMPDFEPQASSVDLMGDIVEAQSVSVAGISALEDDLADCVTDVGALQDDVSAAEGAISSLASGVSALQGDMSTAEGAVSELETSVSALQGGLSSAEGAISELQAAVSSLETDVADADAAISSLNSEVSVLQTDVSAADAAISSLDSEVASLQTDVSAADAAISSLDSEVASLQTDVSAAETAISSLDSELTSLQTDVSAAEAAISSLDSEVASLQTDVSAADAAISSLEGDVSTLQGAVSTAQADISSLESDALALQDDVSSINAVLEDLEALVATATGEGLPGTKTNPAPSCRYVLQVGGDKHNGLYWLDHDGNEEPYQAFCDMGRGGLELVHKLEGGIGGDANSIWTGTGVNADDIAHHSLFQTGGHFMSSKVQGMWDDAGTYLNAVHAGVYNGNRRVAHFSFKAAGSSYTSWFSKTYLVDSSYNDLLTKTGNFFSIVGDDTNGRNWFINEKYGGCEVDAGWMVVDSNGNDPCDWEAAYPVNAILYNKGTTSAAATGYLHADTFAVLVDYDVVYASCLDALQQMNFRARDGQYWINHAGNTANQLVYCDMEHGGYELVFKIVHGGRVSPKWNSGSSSSQNPYVDALWTNAAYDVPLQLGRNVDVHDEEQSYGNGEHYTSPFRYGAFDDSDIFVEDIEVRMVTAEETVKFIQFAGFSQTDDTAWFSKSFLGANSWSDLTPSSQFNYFSIAGHATAGRNWYINSYYGGCDVDSGWIAVVSRVSGCAWEEREYGTPDVMYACSADKFDYCSSAADTGDCATLSTSNSFCYADLLAVFYKWREA